MEHSKEDEIIFSYLKGETYNSIAGSLYTSFTTISRILKQNGIKKHCSWNKGKTKKDDSRIKAPKTTFKEGNIPWLKGTHIQTNTGRTHFKKGRISERKGKKWEEIYDKKTIEYMRKRDRESAINQLLKGTKKKDTLIERIVENILISNNIIFEKQYPYKLGVADFWLPKSNLIVECDGDYWHNIPHMIKRDIKQTKYLESNGYYVLRLKEYEIKKNPEKVEQMILNMNEVR